MGAWVSGGWQRPLAWGFEWVVMRAASPSRVPNTHLRRLWWPACTRRTQCACAVVVPRGRMGTRPWCAGAVIAKLRAAVETAAALHQSSTALYLADKLVGGTALHARWYLQLLRVARLFGMSNVETSEANSSVRSLVKLFLVHIPSVFLRFWTRMEIF